MSVVIDDRIPEDAVEPRDGALFIAQVGTTFEAADKSGLQNVFSNRLGLDPSFEKCQELPMTMDQLFDRNGSRRYCRRNPRSASAVARSRNS
jgi:hypothetical protein